MVIESVVGLVEALRESQVLTPGQVEEVILLQARFPMPRDLARELLQRGWLTAYQINQLFQGRGRQLVLGPYVLLERLGEGGMGIVFKARHQLMNREVALKVIREERLASRQAIDRFRQEIQATARLAHPNVVTAHDAAQVGPTHFLVMEFVQGIDLDKRLRQQGAVPAAEACGIVRQAALGLQHAHERGLVHRDIKPSNLLVSAADGAVKILDLGLARSRAALEGDQTVDRLTREGSFMGSPDYQAPEQAVDSSQADIRADIYSLGCTFYHLLAGRPPFPGGTLAEKILKHQQSQPEPVGLACPGLPPELPRIIEKMMAKHRADRYQTPAEIVKALDAIGRESYSSAAPVAAIMLGPIAKPLSQDTFSDGAPSAFTRGEQLPTVQEKKKSRGKKAWLVPACVGAAVLAIVAVVLVLSLGGGGGSGGGPGDPGDGDRSEGGDRQKKPPAKDKKDKPDTDSARPVRPEPRPTLKETPGLLWELKGSTGPVQCVSFAPDGLTLASGGDDQRVRLWSLETGKDVKPVLRLDESVRSLAWSRDGKWLAAGELGRIRSYIKLWEPRGEKGPIDLKWNVVTGITDPGGIRGLAFSPDGKTLAAGGGPVQLWSLGEKNEMAWLVWQKTFPSYVYGAAFSPDGKTVVAGCHSRGDALRRWDVKTREELSVLVGNKEAFGLAHDDFRSVVAYSPDGTMLVRVTSNGPVPKPASSVMIWDVAEKGQRVTWRDSFEVPPGRVFALRIFGDGEMMVAIAKGNPDSGFRDEPFTDEVKLWDSATKKVRTIKTGHRKNVMALAFSADGRNLATGSQDATVRVWSLADPRKGKD